MTGFVMPFIGGIVNAAGTASQYAQAFRDATSVANSVKQYDQKVMANAAQQIGQLNVARAGLYRQTSAALFSVQQRKRSIQANVAAVSAASDTTGASVQAAMKDSDVQAGKAVGSIVYNMQVQDASIYDAQKNVLQRGMENLKGDDLADIPSRAAVDRVVFQSFWSGFIGSGGGSITSQRERPGASSVRSEDSYDERRGHSYGNDTSSYGYYSGGGGSDDESQGGW